MLGAKLGPVRLNAGPAARLLINSPKDLITDPDFKAMYNDLTFGYQAGIGVDIRLSGRNWSRYCQKNHH